MPWCDSCSAYQAPTALDSGACPVCGGAVEDGPEAEPEAAVTSAPWHFWLVVVLLAAYLFWRLVSFFIWIVT